MYKLRCRLPLVALFILAPGLVIAQERTAYPTLDEPVPVEAAYYPDMDPVADQTQAAYLLVQLNLLDPVEGVDPDEMAPPEDLEAIGVTPALYRVLGQGYAPLSFGELASRHPLTPGDFSPFDSDLVDQQREIALRIAAEPNPADIAELAVISFHHPDLLVRVAAAPLVLLATDARQQALDTLREATGHQDQRISQLALTLLARYSRGDPALAPHVGVAPGDPAQQEPPRTTLVIHGTWASGKNWWRDGGDFFEYLEHGVPIDDLYLGGEPYYWSGDWDHGQRLQAASLLEDWMVRNNEDCVDIIAHSHGANVAFIAAPQLDYGRLVVLSTPSHKNRYPADPDTPTLSVRVRLDLVVLADGGGNRFPAAPNIQETRVGWFNHSATHYPERWVDKGIPGMLPNSTCLN